LKLLVRDKYLVDAQGLNKVKGKPFSIEEVVAAIRQILA
jgi:2-oxoglutarate ferredoxin oxidoreductase subunit alpha